MTVIQHLLRAAARAVAACFGALVLLVAATGLVQAQAVTRPSGDEESGAYVWNAMQGEKLQALAAKGDATRGEIAFEICQGCHRAHALGRSDGSYPRLAGQHRSVLIKQLTDVRAGRRRNDKMLPFADKHVIGPQEIADIAVFLAGLPVPANHGKGPGEQLELGARLYEAECQRCHGKGGEGDEGQFYPRVNGQHFKYMLREMIDIRDGTRTNANPKMIEVVKRLSDAELAVLADHMSRLPVPSPR